MAAPNRTRTLDELARLGEEIFDKDVRSSLGTEDEGKFVAIDVATGDYEMNEDDYAAVTRLRARNSAADIWLMRVGDPTAYKMRALR